MALQSFACFVATALKGDFNPLPGKVVELYERLL